MTKVSDIVDFDENWYKSATADEQKMFREWLLGVLNMHDKVNVTFTKADGTERLMSCTTKEGIRPVVETHKTSDTLCTVWDIDSAAWRSFKFENIKKIDFTL